MGCFTCAPTLLEIEKKAIDFLDKDGITINETATFFPNRTKIDNIDLNNDYRSFIAFSGNEEYVFYSNVFNVSDEDLLAIETKYRLIKRFEKIGFLLKSIIKNKLSTLDLGIFHSIINLDFSL